MRKIFSVYSLLSILFTIVFFTACSTETKETKDKNSKTDSTAVTQEELTDNPNCLDLIKDYKKLAEKFIEVISNLKDSKNLTSNDYVDLLKKSGELEKEIMALGQQKVGETCWQEFLIVQLQLNEAMAKAVNDLSEGNVHGAAIENLNTLNDALNTINKVKEITNN